MQRKDEMPDFGQLLGGMVQQLTKNMPESEKGKLDLTKVVEQVSTIFSNIDKTEEKRDYVSSISLGDELPVIKKDHELIEDDEEVEDLEPCVEDTEIKLDVDLKDVYTGKTVKIVVDRERISGKKIINEKKKIGVLIEPGTRNGQEIRYNRQGNEKFGHLSGDIVVVISLKDDPEFERIGNNLFYVKNISLFESYAHSIGHIKILLKHINGEVYALKSDEKPLHVNDGTRKIKGFGMPYMFNDEQVYGDLYIRFNLILPDKFEGGDWIKYIETLFPVLPNNKITSSNNTTHKEVIMNDITPQDMEQLENESPSGMENSSEEEEN